MTVLRDISFLWAMLHVIILFLLLFEPKYSWHTTLIAVFAGSAAIAAVNVAAMVRMGHGIIMSIAFFSCTVPTMLLNFVLSKYRDGRFFFLFCLTDTTCFWLLQITNFLDRLTGDTYVTMFISRLVLFPTACFLFWRYLSRPYRTLQSGLNSRWWLFTAVGAVYYLLIMATSVPVGTPMPDTGGLIRIILVLILMPLTYLTIFHALWRQMQTYESGRREAEARQSAQVYALQVDAMRHQTQAIQASEAALMSLRHDMRHALNSAAALIQSGDNARALAFIQDFNQAVADTSTTRWCQNASLNAVLGFYLGPAQAEGIQVEARVDIPEAGLPVDALELSIVLANAIENAVNACRRQPPGQPRRLSLSAQVRPQLALEIANTFSGQISLGADGLPVTGEEGHGFGTRSIAAFAERYHAFLQCGAEGGIFRLRLLMGSEYEAHGGK